MSRTCCKRSRRWTVFWCDKWGKGEKDLACSMYWIIFSGMYGQRTMTNEEVKRNVPHLLQAQQALVCGQYWKDAPMRKLHGIFTLSLFPGGYAVRKCKHGPMGQCFSRFISHSSKFMLKVILNRLKPHFEKIIAEEQAGFSLEESPQNRSSTSESCVKSDVNKICTMSSLITRVSLTEYGTQPDGSP